MQWCRRTLSPASRLATLPAAAPLLLLLLLLLLHWRTWALCNGQLGVLALLLACLLRKCSLLQRVSRHHGGHAGGLRLLCGLG